MLDNQTDQHSEFNEREGAQAFLEFVETFIKPLAWTSAKLDHFTDDDFEDLLGFADGKYDDEIAEELNRPNFAEISLSIKQRQNIEIAAMFIERQLSRLEKVGRKPHQNPSAAAMRKRKSRAKNK